MAFEVTLEQILWALWFISVCVLFGAAAYAAFPKKSDYVTIKRVPYSRHASPEVSE